MIQVKRINISIETDAQKARVSIPSKLFKERINMIVFDVIKNGRKLATAGGEDLSVLNVIVNAVGKLGPKSQGTVDEKNNYELFLSTGGLTSRGPHAIDEHIRWSEHLMLDIGDEICIRILDSDSVDAPTQSFPSRSSDDTRKEFEWARKRYFELRALYENEKN
jgi:hypothetical protein